MSADTVIVKIMDKDYQVACPQGQQEALMRSADHLNEQMKTIRRQGKVLGLERIAVMAALNITNELLQSKGQASSNDKQNDKLNRVNDKLDEALARYRQLEI